MKIIVSIGLKNDYFRRNKLFKSLIDFELVFEPENSAFLELGGSITHIAPMGLRHS